jgi:outer membrane cobalamin receptor
MRPFRSRRLHAVCQPLLVVIALGFSARVVAQGRNSPGVVVDEDGRPVPRALVRVVEAGRDSASVFADERGRFDLPLAASADCRIVASLAGFEPAEAPCAAEPLRLELKVGPIRESVLVTATRTEAPASQAGASATVFTAEDLERRQVPFVADLVGTTPGAMMIRSGAPGTLTSLFVRGGESDYNKVLVDGIPLNEPGGSFYLNNLTTENLDRIEIVRGAYSSLFGSDAMASVIQLFTRRADGTARRPRGSVQIDGGTYGTLHANASVAGATSRLDYSGGVAQYNSDNRVPNSGLENTTLSGNLGIRVGGNATLRMITRAELENVGTPGPTAFGRPDLDASFDRDDVVFSIAFDQAPNGRFKQRTSYSTASSGQTSTNLVQDPPYTATFEGRTAVRQSSDFVGHSQADLRRHHASYQADLQVAASPSYGDHRLTLIADWDGERATQENLLAGTTTRNSRDNFGVAAQHQMLWPRFFATLGARVERNESFGTDLAPRATVVYVARTAAARAAFGETRLRASAGTGSKEPTMLESFSISPFALGNLDLNPERSRSVEVGIDQRFARDRARVEATWFDNRFRNIISVRSDPVTFVGHYFNVGVTEARGLELGFEAAPLPAIRIRGAYTLLDSEIVETTVPDNVLFAPGQWAFRRPRHSGSAGASVNWRRITADVNAAFIGAFVDSDFGLFDPPLTENPGHSIWETRVSLAVTRQLSGILSIDNLTNADYSEPFGYQPLGRVVRAGVRVAF